MYGIQLKYPINHGTVPLFPDVREESKNTSRFVVWNRGDREICECYNSYVSQQSKILEAAYHQVQNRMGLQQDRQKEVYDRGRHGEPFK